MSGKGPQAVCQPNHLIDETSPYLLQHAYNPVDWYSWCSEAHERARALDKPILLSIGYSACHWCHVMEEESFEDVEIATYINANYVAIKVDREERHDVDDLCMPAVRIFNRGRGGWPMTVVMTPSRVPLFAATCIPARDGAREIRTGCSTARGPRRPGRHGMSATPCRVGRNSRASLEIQTNGPSCEKKGNFSVLRHTKKRAQRAVLAPIYQTFER